MVHMEGILVPSDIRGMEFKKIMRRLVGAVLP